LWWLGYLATRKRYYAVNTVSPGAQLADLAGIDGPTTAYQGIIYLHTGSFLRVNASARCTAIP
jgi:hypothetical protein